MRVLTAILVGGLGVFLAAGAHAGVSLGASCNGGVVTCAGEIYNNDYDWQGIVIQWRYGNLCGHEYHPIAMDPIPLPPPEHFSTYQVTFAVPDADEWLEYRAFYIAPDGTLHGAPGMGDPQPFGWASCADPVLSRGYITGSLGSPFLDFAVCPDTCWFLFLEVPFAYIVVDGVDPATYEDYLNSDIAVNVWGVPHVDGMPGGTTINVTAISPVPPDEPACGPPVATASIDWGTMKSWYR